MDIGPVRRRLTAEPLESPVPGERAPQTAEPAAEDRDERAGRPTGTETVPTA